MRETTSPRSKSISNIKVACEDRPGFEYWMARVVNGQTYFNVVRTRRTEYRTALAYRLWRARAELKRMIASTPPPASRSDAYTWARP